MAETILVTGGAGYIGSHNVKYLRRCGYRVLVLDDLRRGFAEAVSEGLLVQGSTGDRELLDRVFGDHDIDAVMHFAAYIEVGESVEHPAQYYGNNVANTITLLDAMVRHGVGKFVLSSTAAIFGPPEYTPIDEDHPKAPINPYGRSKWLVEQLLPDYAAAYGLRSVCLRYFNAAGADPDGKLGERHQPETHLIPLVLQAASGRRDSISIFGDDYPTADGTCVRDYIHVEDLAQAHRLAVEHISNPTVSSVAFNLGNGAGYSIRQVIDTAQRITGRAFTVESGPRRPGDPASLVADSTRAKAQLGWAPRFPDLESIVGHAWAWELQKDQKW